VRRSSESQYLGALSATLSGIAQRLCDRGPPLALTASDRLDGRVCLVTGANRGLGSGIAGTLRSLGAQASWPTCCWCAASSS
jgi:hypothetical protein